jgi:hypothetical protein
LHECGVDSDWTVGRIKVFGLVARDHGDQKLSTCNGITNILSTKMRV